jgi:hypothetical protein
MVLIIINPLNVHNKEKYREINNIMLSFYIKQISKKSHIHKVQYKTKNFNIVEVYDFYNL